MNSKITLLIIIVGAVSTMCQIVAWRVRIPSILFLLISGIILGPITNYFNPDKLFGDLLFPIISLAVAIILFEGSLTLKFKEIQEQKHYILRFVFIGGLITFLGISIATSYILNLNWSLSILIGAILVVTGPTVIMPMLRAIRPHAQVAQMLRWEGIVLDPFGAILAVLVFDFIISDQNHNLLLSQGLLLQTVSYFTQMVVTGILLGFFSGLLLGALLISYWLPKFLVNIVVLNFVLAVFVIANLCYHETGLLAVTVMGITLANRKHLDLTSILDFKETLSTLLISSLFIVLAARIDLSSLKPMIIPSILLFLVMQLIIRPIKVLLTTMGSHYDLPHKIVLSWIAPRGIIAAAIASLFEMKLMAMGYQQGAFITPLIFLIIVWSVVLPSFTGGFLAKWLKVSEPEPIGILIVGANLVAREIAKSLTKNGCEVLVADFNWEDISLARMQGLQTYYGNPISEHAEYNLSLLSIGKMLSITPNTELGVLAGLHFSREIGKKGIYYLQTEQEKKSNEKNLIARQHRGKMLFGTQVTYEELIQKVTGGAQIRSTLLSEQFTYDDYISMNNGNITILYAFDIKHNLVIYTTETQIKPGPGWTIVGFGFFS